MRNKKLSVLLMGMWAAFGLNGLAEEHTRPAEFWIGQTVVQTNPAGFGAEFTQYQRINNWTDNPGMEPLDMKEYWELSDGGTDATGDYAVCSTRLWDTVASGFFDGAHYRLYRENMVEGRIEKIREGTIPTGGYIADGYMEVGNGSLAVKAYAPNVEATDDYLIENGETWYYAVKARDSEGNWSDFSAAVAGVTPAAGIANEPRIKTQTVKNPTVGKAYTESSPLVTLTALGGDLPLSWSVLSGALPAGMTLGSDGKIYGTCSSSDEITFVARVTDNSSESHDRIFTMFRPAPSGDEAAPSAPSNVVVEAHDGFVHLRWDVPSESDVESYQVYRSRVPESQHMERIYLGGSGTAPEAADLLFVEMEVMNAPPKDTRSIRVLQYQSESAWNTKGTGTELEFVAHPGVPPAQFANEYPGEGCLKVSNSNDVNFGIFCYRVGNTNSGWWGAGQLPTNQTYRMECWVYGEGISVDTLRFQFPNYTDQTVTGIVEGAWTKLSVDFEVTNWLASASGTFGPTFYFDGPGTVYIDNAVTYNVNDPRGPCAYSESIFDLWMDYTGPTNVPKKGVFRVRYNNEAFKNVMNPAVMTMRDWNRTRGARRTDPQHIHDVFLEALASGSTPETRNIPWIIASLEWAEADFVNLVEYLAGPAGTPYGDLRIEQRGGVTTPWTDEFRKIYLEMGNEPWNTGYFFGFRGGFSAESGTTYGRWCQYIWNHVWTNSTYMNDTIKPVLGGWISSVSTNGFSANARRECPRAEHLSSTMYIGGWETGQAGQIGGTDWSDDGLQQWPIFLDYNGKDKVNSTVTLRETMTAEGLPFDWLVYESGPSYLMNGLNGVSLTPEQQATSDRYGRTLAAGIGALEYWMYGVYRNYKEIAFFQFEQDGRTHWASHSAVHKGYRPHPAWLALTMYNHHIPPASMLLTTPLSLPTFDLEYEKDGNTVLEPDMTLASMYAFRDGNRYAVLLLNKKVDGEHNGYDFGDGTTPATVHLPFSGPESITLYKMDGDPRETNVDQLNVQIATQLVDIAHFSQEFVVDEDTGGVSNGLPVGAVYLYVFEGCTPDTLPANPQVSVNQAPVQDDPQNGSTLNEIRFTVIFDRPVTGFDSVADVTLGGTASPQTVAINEITENHGTTYEVVVSGMSFSGTVTLSVPAGAAQAVDGGNSNDASTSFDNSVAIHFPTGLSLLEWEFMNLDELPEPPFQDPDATGRHPKMKTASLGFGSGCRIRDNQWYNDDGYAILDADSPALDLNDYLTWTVSPSNSWEMSLFSIQLGAFCMSVSHAYDVELRWSTDGFSGHETVHLTPANPLIGGGLTATAGTELQGNLSGFSALQSTTNAVEFRLYFWNAGRCGIGKLGKTEVDLEFMGFVAEEGYGQEDDDGDGLPNGWEIQYYSGATNANPAATASNGINTVKDCYIAGLDPTDEYATFLISDFRPLTSGNTLHWQNVSGRVYSVYWASNLLGGFQALETNVAMPYSDTNHPGEEKGFYKIEVELE